MANRIEPGTIVKIVGDKRKNMTYKVLTTNRRGLGYSHTLLGRKGVFGGRKLIVVSE